MSPLEIPTSAGTLHRYEYFPSQLVPVRHCDVWLPPGYAAADGLRYPVVYMPDGQNLFLPGYSLSGQSWGIDHAVARLMGEGRISGAIVVGIWNTGDSRWAEYLPQKPVGTADAYKIAERYPALKPGDMRADAFLRFVVKELMPFIDASYRTRAGRSGTSMMGSSLGALISL
ncbi:MAG TPA: alpha/beta hydrolase-fold protein, partial [Candidatus Acidoferrum sp.]|nr:alpha/beta hydrolase-fold protein [Candidatus Acidoferrum sp.]